MTEYRRRLYNLYQELNIGSETVVDELVEVLYNCVMQGNAIWIMGNGGSASTSEHFEIDLLYIKQKLKNIRIRATALSANSAVTSAISNDLGYSEIFSKQIERKASQGDVCFFISASGNSENLIQALKMGKQIGLKSIALLGFDGGKLLQLVDYAFLVNSKFGEYGIVEDVHLSVCHEIAELLLSKITISI